MSVSSMVNIGVIGAGIGQLHIEGYQSEPRARVVAVAGLDQERVQALAKRHELRAYGDYRELLEQPDIDAISVCVPNYLHAEVTLAALQAGKHVLCEKPLAMTVAEGEEMVAAARTNRRVLAVAFSQRSRGDCQTLRRHIEEGSLGHIYYAKASWMRRNGIPGIGTWFTQRHYAGGGALTDLGVHLLDMALWLMGNPKVLSVSAATYRELGSRGQGNSPWRPPVAPFTFDVEDLATALIRIAGGVTLQLEASWATHSGAQDDFGVTLMGTRGGGEIFVRNYGYDNTLRLYHDVSGVPADTFPRLPKLDGHAAVARRFVASILDDLPASPSGEEGLDRVRVLDACYRSAAEGREVTIA